MGYHLKDEAAAEPRARMRETGRMLTGFESVRSGYRYYSSELGRWINRDPIQEEGGFNLYLFAVNEPIWQFDYLGLWVSPREFWRTYSELRRGYRELREFIREHNLIGDDKYFHCLAACRAARAGDRDIADTLLRLRELGDLLWHRAQRLLARIGIHQRLPSGRIRQLASNIEAARDSLEDMQANLDGLDCPVDLTCECCCEKYKVL